MTIQAKYVFVASMDVDPARDELFNQIYDREHIPNLLTVPGVATVNRYRSRAFSLLIGGERRQIAQLKPTYHAFYELASPDVLLSDSWARAIDAGRWPGEIRPHTLNRQHRLLERLATEPIA